MYKTAKKLVLAVCKKYPDAKSDYKHLIAYCFMEQGCQFPLSLEDLLRCYSTETIRRSFQDLKKKGEIEVPAEKQAHWNRLEKKHRAYFRSDLIPQEKLIFDEIQQKYIAL